MDLMAARPACQRGVMEPEPFEADEIVVVYARKILVK
jgi:hypothetical protein